MTKTAEDIMIPLHKYPNIPKWFTIRQAIQLIQQTTIEMNGIVSRPRALLVTDENFKIVGMIRRRDILRSLEPKNFFGLGAEHPKIFGDIVPNLDLIEIAFDRFSTQCIKHADEFVWKYMVPIEHFLNHDDHLMKIIYMIDLTGMSMFLVVKDDAIIGVVRTIEVLNEVSKMLQIE